METEPKRGHESGHEPGRTGTSRECEPPVRLSVPERVQTGPNDGVSGIEERYAIYRMLARLWLQEPDAELLAVLRGPAAELFAAFGGSLEVGRSGSQAGDAEGPAPGTVDPDYGADRPSAGLAGAEQPILRDAGGVPQAADGDAGPIRPVDWIAAAAEDFCHLWIGPSGHLPPYQSVWEQSELSGAASSSVRAYLEQLEQWSLAVPRPSGGAATESDVGWLLEPATQRLGRCRIAEVDHLGAELLVMSDLLVCEATGAAPRGTAADFFRAHLTWPGELLAFSLNRARTPFYRSVVAMTRQFVLCEAVTLAAAR